MKIIDKKLKQLPARPGVYLYKNASGEIIYIGKAASLRGRVRQYFQKSRAVDAKTDALIADIADLEWITVETEMDALFLEAELVRRYLPRYNILLRDDKSSLYIRLDYDSPHPTLTFTRRPLDDKARYYGPYFNGNEVKRALRYLRKIFPYSTHNGVLPRRACLQYHLGLCPGLEENKTSLNDYRANLRKLIQYIKGERVPLIGRIEKDMKRAAAAKNFETAAKLRNQIYALKAISKQIVFSDKEFMDLSRDRALLMLSEVLGLDSVPYRIEGYDISHMQGTDNVASMVVFTNGIPYKTAYRKFKMRLPGNNDFGHMEEAIRRRLSQKNQKAWGLPDMFLIDGGRGQLSAALRARDEAGVKRPMIALAKREEEIVVHGEKSLVAVNMAALNRHNAIIRTSSDYVIILLPKNSDAVKLLQRVRDESHRFAVSYHTVLKIKRQTASRLDGIPGIGPASRKKLLRTFGSSRAIEAATPAELSSVIGSSKAKLVSRYLADDKLNALGG
jgi:excinuclease ABC subunit C